MNRKEIFLGGHVETVRRALPLGVLLAACGSDDETTETGGELPGNDSGTEPPAGEPTLEDPADSDALDAPVGDLPLGGGPYPIADVTFGVDLCAGNATSVRDACLGDTAAVP